jgi:hypothetical protein
MIRRFTYLLMGLALLASVHLGFARDAGAEYYGDPCAELISGIEYSLDQHDPGYFRYAMWLYSLGVERGCPQFV